MNDRPDLATLLAFWQGELRLLDWRIEISYSPDLQLNGKDVYGLCQPFVDNKMATIQVRDPATLPRIPGCSVEDTVLHELLHLHFAAFGGRKPAEVAAEEQAVWALTETLMRNRGTSRGHFLARAMVAAFATNPLSAPAQGQEARRKRMDPIIVAALKAALTAEDPKAAIEALLAQLEASGGEAAPPAGDTAQQPPQQDGPKPPPAQQAPKPHRASAPAPGSASIDITAEVRAQLAGLDTFKRDFLLETRGHALPETQRKWAGTQSYEVVKGLLDATPDTGSDRRSAARAQSPTKGGGASSGGASSSGEHVDGIVDRAMGVARNDTPAVTIDPITNKLSISALRPLTVGVTK